MFFNQFPKSLYSVQNNAIQTVITDYFRYVDVVDRLAQNSYAYNRVDIINAERPDTVSHRLYGTPDYYWTFFITNDPLKEGLSAWPKGDSEIKNHIANQYKNISAFRFPISEPDTQGRRSTIIGIPIKNKDYLPYLRLCKVIGFEQNKRVFASAKIVDYDPNMSIIWIDNSDITWSAEDASVNAQIGTGSALDIKYSAESQTEMFYDGPSSADFSVQFRADTTSTKQLTLRSLFIEEVRAAALRFRANSFFDTRPAAVLDMDYTLTTTQYWKDGSLAPAHYYDAINTNEEISEYSAGPEASNYVSIYDDTIEENNLRKTIKVVDPIYIESFAREFKKLLNE